MNTTLSSIPLFSNLSNEHLELLSTQACHLSYAKNRVVIAEGDCSDSLYIVKQGRIRIYISDSDGREMLLNELSAGDYFGELSLIDHEPRSASAKTLCDCEVSVITSEDFMRCLNNNPEMAVSLTRELAKRLRVATNSQRQLALMDVYGRLKATLLALSTDEGGVSKVEPKPTQQELANMIGASREMVSRIFKNLKADGYIETSKTSITIRKSLPDNWS
jgi:CRP/FNR family cyclic AMP-dependent transcriptional regulator